ncbi:MAG: tetratricopeptide repeat protein [Rhodobacteraceae bacterium]|nr:tetratricopeptide repeat protein [Paracoccaceae bacterium]
MTTDCLGNPISETDPEVIRGIDDFIEGFLAYQTRAVTILGVIGDHPASCLGNAYAGFLYMFLESPQAPDLARPFAERALAAAGTPREQANARVLAAWVAGDIPQVIHLCDEAARQWPGDLALIKLGQYHLFNLGDAVGMLRMALHALPPQADAPYLHGMIAFGYEQCHLLDQAESAARRAMEIVPSDPWAHHALAHVMLTQGRVDEGIAFLESVSGHWAGLNSFMQTHNWWHLALFYLSRDRVADVLAVYDTHVWGLEKDYSQDQVGAVSLLARMEFAGIDVGARWQDVAAHIARRGADTTAPFLTLQYLFALERADRPEARALMQAIVDRADTPAHDRAAWAEVALPAARGITAHAQGNAAEAARLLGRALPRMREIGGSHAQRDFFEQIHLDALTRSGNWSAAQQVLELRRAHDPDGIPLNRHLAQVYDAAGLPAEAARARARIGA